MTIVPESQKPLSETIFVGEGEMAALMRSHDWSTTPLGPVENWSPTLRTTVSTILASLIPQFILWGENYIQLYNDAGIALYGTYHPGALGQPIHETWAEVWDNQLKPMFEGIRNTGKAFWTEELPYHILRFGFLEETYFNPCYSPIRDEMGRFCGILCISTETTRQVIGQRRLTMLRELATAGNGAKTLQSACVAAAAALNPYDIPFALFYQVNEQGNWAERVALSGLNADSAAAPGEIDLTDRSTGWSLADVLQSREPLLLTDVVDRFGSFPIEPWGESPHSAFILPVLSSNKEQVECLLVAGISPRLQFNAEYRSFLELVVQQIESSIAAARSYEAERKRAEALADLDRAKTTFFSNVSHEFRTPLTLMLNPAKDALTDLEEPLSLNQRQRLEVVHRNGLRLLKLVNTLLDVSRIESGRVSAVYEPIDLASFTAELASVFRSVIESADLRLVVDCSPLSEPIYIDREMWEKIVFNLLSNAFKFTFTGEIRVSLRESETTEEPERETTSLLSTPHIILEVCDTGMGIPAAEIPRLFDRFHQVKGAQGRTVEGSGIGLSLVQELVKLHGGTVQVESVEAAGSRFTVVIPTGSAHLPQAQIGAERTLTPTTIGASPYVEEALRWLPEQSSEVEALNSEIQPPTVETQPKDSNIQPPSSNHQAQSPSIQSLYSSLQAQSQNIQALYSNTQAPSSDIQALNSNIRSSSRYKTARVLLVDDNADMRDYVKRLLSENWSVETAENGAIALAKIQNQPPDLVLSDVMMPDMDGFELLRALRSHPNTKGIPIILLSARAGEEAAIEGLGAGADDYLIKPFSARELITRVNTQLQMSQLRQERSANRLKDEFLLTVTHELQSPLATILGWSRFLQTKPLDQDTLVRALAAIERNATIEAKLVRNLLDVSSILAGKLSLKPQLIELAPLVENVTATFRDIAQAKQIQLVETRSDGVPNYIFVDGDRLKQVIANLLDNAIKFTPLGGQVSLELQRLESHLQMTISDTGIGIRPDFLPYVFDRFTQAEVPSPHTPGGVGLGLTIARHLIEFHHGTIEATSEGEGRGATFTVRLPLTNATTLSSNSYPRNL